MKRYATVLLLFGHILAAYSQNISLFLPQNNDTLETLNPLFSWSYLANSIESNERIFYRFLLVELQDNQTAEAGLLLNQPRVLMDQIPGNQLFYPFDAPQLTEGKWYGWQLQKVANQVIIDKSEAYRFYIPMPPVVPLQYFKVKQHEDGQNYPVLNGKLCIEFPEPYKENALHYTIYDPNGSILTSPTQLKRTGSNYYQITLGTNPTPGVYHLVVYDAKKRKYEINFIAP